MPAPKPKKELLIALFILGCLAFNYPLLALFSRPSICFGLPTLFLYLFMFWAFFILVLALVMEKRKKTRPVPSAEAQSSDPRDPT
ncbi:MAG: hypothetical protein L3J03_01655 [Desulfobacterales bacterium]|nr:hypothetical protein [Desulfobacterales bacterium]